MLRGYAATAPQAQRLREKAEDLFLQHRKRGGYAAQNDQTLPKEERSALYELKQEGNRLWEEAKELVQAASEQVLRESQVSAALHPCAVSRRELAWGPMLQCITACLQYQVLWAEAEESWKL